MFELKRTKFQWSKNSPLVNTRVFRGRQVGVLILTAIRVVINKCCSVDILIGREMNSISNGNILVDFSYINCEV
jgi:hypothetical protein